MKPGRHFAFLAGCLSLLIAAACSPAAASSGMLPAVEEDGSLFSSPPAVMPTHSISTEVLPQSSMEPPGNSTALPTLKQSPTSLIFESLAATPCPLELCLHSEPFTLERPIAQPGRDTIDTSYRFGSTQAGKRDPHHGVEFLNPAGTPVLAAADGEVVVAGDDRLTLYGPYSYFFGNLVVLRHRLPAYADPVYTLYAHLSEILVVQDQQVKAGDEIGRVGMSGVATGSHLHFEVRLGENSYKNVRNPELWLKPKIDENGELQGAIAGRILASPWINLKIPSIVVERIPAPGEPAISQIYIGKYEEKGLAGLEPWEENFAVGDLPPGWYRISFVQYGMQQREVQVLPGGLTVVTFDLTGEE